MSLDTGSIIYFDIRNFSTHVSYLSLNKNEGIIFDLVTKIIESLEKAIDKSRTYLGISRQVFVNHTGDGFLAIFDGNDRSLQSLFVASLLSNDVHKLIREYEEEIEKEKNLMFRPLDFGIGIHLGKVKTFKYYPEYPGNYQMSGFFGNAINVSQRVQESTKDHYDFRVICTRLLYDNAFKLIKDEHKATFVKCFTKLDRHNLRGMSGPYTLYGLKKDLDLAKRIKPDMTKIGENKKN